MTMSWGMPFTWRAIRSSTVKTQKNKLTTVKHQKTPAWNCLDKRSFSSIAPNFSKSQSPAKADHSSQLRTKSHWDPHHAIHTSGFEWSNWLVEMEKSQVSPPQQKLHKKQGYISYMQGCPCHQKNWGEQHVFPHLRLGLVLGAAMQDIVSWSVECPEPEEWNFVKPGKPLGSLLTAEVSGPHAGDKDDLQRAFTIGVKSILKCVTLQLYQIILKQRNPETQSRFNVQTCGNMFKSRTHRYRLHGLILIASWFYVILIKPMGVELLQYRREMPQV